MRLLFALGLCASSALAAPQSLIPLQRITVGPYDNYQATIDAKEKNLIYTRAQNLSSQIMQLDLATGLTRELTLPDADASSPALSPDGETLAFTYFKMDAKGDVCLLEDKEIRCLTQPGKVEHSPFWIDTKHLAYIASNDQGSQNQLRIYDLDKKQSSAVIEGSLYGPSLSPDGKTVVYKSKGNDLNLLDLTSRKVMRTIAMPLPGVTGPARFSQDGRYLYFAQYIVDSNRDLTLDGRDAAAIFRLDLNGGEAAFPEQLTSLEQNCSYPFPLAHSLYMTCAFEGALDIYKAPLEGTVPAEWTADTLWEAHMTARTASDRILILNRLFTRFKALDVNDFNERSLANFSSIDAYLPAAYYAHRLAPTKKSAAVEQLLLETYGRWDVLPQKTNLGQFAVFLNQQEALLKPLQSEPLAAVAAGFFDFFAQDKSGAAQRLKALKSDDPRAVYWRSRLQRLLFREGDPTGYRKSLAAAVQTSGISLQTQLFYLSLWLEELPPASEPQSFSSDFSGGLATQPLVKELIDNEQDLHRLLKSPDRKAEIAVYQGIVERVKRLKDQYYPLRLLFNRSLIVLTKAKRSKDMANIVSLWLSYLKKDTTEYPYALEAMRRNTLDVAYRLYHAKGEERLYAGGSFYSSIRASDDLESHYQYALLNLEPKAWTELAASYALMIKDGVIRPESLDFVQVVKGLQAGKQSASDFADAAKRIDSLPDSYIGLGVKYLLLGYLYQREMVLKQKGFTFNRELADKAHRAYLFAIDAAYGNDRILAAALQNLALLHSSLRNYSLAADFFIKRQELPFNDRREQEANFWLGAQTLYRSYRPQESLATIEKLLALPGIDRSPALLEKAAFYAWNAQDYAKAVPFYAELMKAQGGKGNLRGGVYLGYGYALRGLNRPAEAEKMLLQAVTVSEKEKAPAAPEGSVLAYQPLKVRFTALGLLARLELPWPSRIAYLQRRLALFPEVQKLGKILHFSDEALSEQVIKETQDLAFWLATAQQPQPSLVALQQALALAEKHAEAFSYLSAPVLTASKNAMIFCREQKFESAAIEKSLQKIMMGAAKEYQGLSNASALVTQKWGELRLVQAAYALRKDASKRERFAAAAKALLGETAFINMAKDKPAALQALSAYQKGVEEHL